MGKRLDKWNVFAKKKIFINSDFQIGVGRLVFVFLVTFIEAIGMAIVGAGVGIPSLVLNAMLTMEKRDKEDND